MSSSLDRAPAVPSGRESGEDDRSTQLKEELAGLQKAREDDQAVVVEKLADRARDGEFDGMDEDGYCKAKI